MMAGPLVLWTLASPPPNPGGAGAQFRHLPFLRIKHLFHTVTTERLAPCRSAIITSANAVPPLAPHMARLQALPFFAIGDATRRALQAAGVERVGTPERATGRDLIVLLETQPPAEEVFFPRGSQGTQRVLDYLKQSGLSHYSPVVYRSEPRLTEHILAEVAPKLWTAVVLGSPSAVKGWNEVRGAIGPETPIATMGPTTSAACREHGFDVWLEAESGSAADVAGQLAQHLEPAGRAA